MVPKLTQYIILVNKCIWQSMLINDPDGCKGVLVVDMIMLLLKLGQQIIVYTLLQIWKEINIWTYENVLHMPSFPFIRLSCLFSFVHVLSRFLSRFGYSDSAILIQLVSLLNIFFSTQSPLFFNSIPDGSLAPKKAPPIFACKSQECW